MGLVEAKKSWGCFDVLIYCTFTSSVSWTVAKNTWQIRDYCVCVHVVQFARGPINLLNMKSTICYPAEIPLLFIDIFQLIINLPKYGSSIHTLIWTLCGVHSVCIIWINKSYLLFFWSSTCCSWAVFGGGWRQRQFSTTANLGGNVLFITLGWILFHPRSHTQFTKEMHLNKLMRRCFYRVGIRGVN